MKFVFYLDNLRDSYFLDVDLLDSERYTYITSTNAEDVFRVMNVVTGEDFELPNKLGCRSMSVGDIYVEGKDGYLCAPVGWTKLPEAFVERLLGRLPCSRCDGPPESGTTMSDEEYYDTGEARNAVMRRLGYEAYEAMDPAELDEKVRTEHSRLK